MAERPAKILVVDDVPENVRLLEAVLVPRGYEVVTAHDGVAALERRRGGGARPDPARRDDARPRRLRGLHAPARERRHRRAAGDHGHVEHRPGEDEGDRGRRGRLHPQAVQPRRAAHAGAVAAPDQALPRHDQGAGGRARRAQPNARGAGGGPGRASSSGCGGCGASSRRSSPTPSSPRETRRSSRATAGRWRCSSPTCAAGRASSTPSSPRS